MTTTTAERKTTTSTKSAAKATTVPDDAVVVDNYVWHATEFGKFRVEESRWGTFISIDKDGQQLVTGLTEEAVITVTPMHLEANSPDYDGKYDGAQFSSSVGVKL